MHSSTFLPGVLVSPARGGSDASYEVWIASRPARGALPDLDAIERRDLARALKTVLLKLRAVDVSGEMA